MRRRWLISRRTVLRGAGAIVALPLLEQMIPPGARAQAAGAPVRLLVFYSPCGVNVAQWMPTGEGAGYQLSPSLAPLAPVKGDILLLSGLSHEPGRPDGPGHHAAATAAFLTCKKVYKTDGADIRNGISMDQVVANALRGQTRFASLELGTEKSGGVGSCDSGYACSYAQNIAWAGPTTPIPKETEPRAVFERLFGAGGGGGSTPTPGAPPPDTAEQARQRVYRKSILDMVREDSKALQARLGVVDRQKMDEYLTGVRELERQLEHLEHIEQGGPAGPVCQGGVPPEPQVTDVRLRTKSMLDLMVLAFKCDLTRVITFMIGNARTDRVYDFLGLKGAHHAYSHHDDIAENLAALAKVDHWVAEQLLYLLQQMKAVVEPGGTLLDNALVYSGNEVQDPDRHGHLDLPIILAGRGGGAVTPGRRIVYRANEPVANLLISMMQAVGVSVQSFGDDGTGPLHSLRV
ncbi:MAG: DUF1552 domain-containing protein [Myxococcaceae bacterium]|nr:DUF1552 domain-containing protein [Myxococcaceae bacterium]